MSIKIKWDPSLGKLTSCSSLPCIFCKINRIHLSICTHECVNFWIPCINDTGKMLGAWKARYKWCFSQTMQMLVRSLRKLTYLVCVQWKEFLTGHSNQDNCAVSKYSGMHTVSKYLYIFFYFNVLFCLSARTMQLLTDISGQTCANATFHSKNYWSLFSWKT